MPRVRVKPKLKEYKAKRHFDRTAEPGPKVSRSRSGRLFVVQKHDASRLHYDFRLEHNGVLKSWAVPKGPSLDPSEKTLAVEVEDHPVDYGSFEGVIPEGEYGGGTVLLWDKGTWTPVGDPDEGLRTGKLKFDLYGQKLRGRWMLVRMHGRKGDEDKRNWLLFKERDAESHTRAEGDVREDEPLSVATGRDMDAIASDRDRAWGSNRRSAKPKPGSLPHGNGRKRRATSNPAAHNAIDASSEPGARESPMGDDPAPELATLVDGPPSGSEWLHEIKFDGYRILCLIKNGKARLVSRNANDWTPRFRDIARAAEALPVNSAVLDGEVVVLGSSGRTDFQSLQNLLKGLAPRARLLYFAFDLLYLDGFDLTHVPLIRRKALLRRVLRGEGKDSELRYSEHIEGRGRDVFDEACRNHLEGIVSKRADSRYIARRTKDWLKCKCESRQEFVIGGYTEPSGGRTQFGALLLGYFDRGSLVYCGKVGTGFNTKTLRSILTAMKPHEVSKPAFKNPPTGSEARGVHWLEPALVGEVQFSEWTRDGTLRHPSFQGLREDKKASEVVREEPKHAAASENGRVTAKHNGRHPEQSAPAKAEGSQVAGVQLSHPDRVLYPEQNITKLELARYYESIADWVLPHMINRPLTLVRCPQGRQAACFYQKHLTERMPASVHGVMIREKDGKEEEYVAVDNLQGLLGLVQLGVLEFHPWGCRDDKVDRPDRLVMDLDPGPGVEWGRVAAAALLVRDRLEHAGLRSFLKTTGGKGLHAVIPIERRTSWDDAKAFTKLIADGIVRDYPDQFTTNMSKSKRTNKIFVDYLRNGRGATAIAPYSTRARENATVATPLAWDELSEDLKPGQFTIRTIPDRLAALKRDPWEQIEHTRQSITAAMLKRKG